MLSMKENTGQWKPDSRIVYAVLSNPIIQWNSHDWMRLPYHRTLIAAEIQFIIFHDFYVIRIFIVSKLHQIMVIEQSIIQSHIFSW